MTSFVETCYLNRDTINIATPSIHTHKNNFHSHHRSNSSQLTYTTQTQSPVISAFAYPPQLSQFSLNKKEDLEPKSFQTPTTYSQIMNKSMIKQEFFSEMISKKSSQTRVSRVYDLEEMKPETSSTEATNKTQAQNENTSSNNLQSSEIFSATVSPSPLLLQFGNMDLRKRQSLFPVKPVEMSFDKQLEFKLGSKFRNLKIDNKIGDNENNDECNSDEEENDTNNIQKHYIIDDFDNNSDEDIDLNNEEDETQEYTNEDLLFDLVLEIKSEKNHSIKSILKKSSSISKREHLSTCPDNTNSYQMQNIQIKQSQNILQHQRSSSLSELSSLNINSSIEAQYNQQQYFSPIKNTYKEEDYSNLLLNSDLNQLFNQLSHKISKDYQPTNMITSPEKCKSQIHRSYSFSGLTKKVTFMISPSKEDTLTNLDSLQTSYTDLSHFQHTPVISSSSSLSNSQINQKKVNSFNKFYSAFKQSLINSQTDIFSTPQEKLTNNRSNNNSTSSTVSTIPSLSSFSQCSSLQNGMYYQSTPSSTCSTPLASQTSMSNIISPLTNQQIFERKNASHSSILNAFKDMKLTKNTKLYLDQKMKKPSSSTSRISENLSYLKTNSEGSTFNPDSPTLVKLSFEDFRNSPSSDIIFRSANS